MAKYVQLVKRGDKWYLRAMPYTAEHPTENQIKARIKFAEIAKKAKGKKFTGGLPPAAELIKREMKGQYFGRTRKLKKWQKILMEEAKTEEERRYIELLVV